MVNRWIEYLKSHRGEVTSSGKPKTISILAKEYRAKYGGKKSAPKRKTRVTRVTQRKRRGACKDTSGHCHKPTGRFVKCPKGIKVKC